MVAAEKRTEKKLIHFEGFTLDVGKRGLFRKGERVHLTAKPLETLIFLVENRGRIVSKQEILDAVWKDTFVTEDVLVQAIREIRRVLEDNKDDPRFIQTVPRQGYRFIGDVSVELPFVKPEMVESTPLTVVPKQEPAKWLWLQLGFIALTGIVIISTLVWFMWKRPTQTSETEKQNPHSTNTLNPRPVNHVPTGEFPAGKPMFSPDGKLILYVGSSQETRGYGNIFIMPASGGNAIPITEKANPSGDMPVFTSDGSHVVFSRPYSGKDVGHSLNLYIVPSSGGEMKLYITEASGAGFSPDGKWVVYTKHLPSQDVLWISPTNNLNEHKEIAAGGFTPRWSPDGKWIAYTTSNPNGGNGDLWIVDTATLSNKKNLSQSLQQLYGLTWTAESSSIIFSSKRTGPQLLWKISIDDGLIEPINTGIGECAAPSVSSDGKTLVFHYVRPVKDLILVDDLQKKDKQQITQDEYHEWLRMSPSGEEVASVIERPDFGKHLYITNLKTKQQTRLSDSPAHHPCWLDKENLAYLMRDNSTEQTKVQVVNLASKVTTTLTQFSGVAEWLAVHPDKRKVAVVLTITSGTKKIVLRDLDNQVDKMIAEGGQYAELRWLPDGTALSWSGTHETSQSNNGIWLNKTDALQPQRIVDDGYCPIWSADSSIVYYSRIREFSGLWQFDLKQKKETKFYTWEEVSFFDIAGKRLVYAQSSGRGQIYSLALNQ